ncbi:hypothetical protein NC651_011867 [Populus alba x Populus x berolinensis]|nr:hypothetical protein NC651_011867 [Populus alba x Populus x berolinensis]
MKKTVIYSPKPQDISWLNNCLLASIFAGADYGKIQDDLISCDIQSTGMRFLGASQVLLLFEDHPSMMHAFEADLPYWDKYFDDIRPWLSTDCAIDRLAWVSIQGLPIVGWNRNCLATLLKSTGDIIGFDHLGLRRSTLVSLRLLLGRRSDEDIRKTIILHIDGEDHTICIDEIDSLHYPMVDSICYSMDTFLSNLVLEDAETTHDVWLDTGDKMKSFSNYEEAASDKPHLAGDIAYRCTETTRGQVHFPTMFTDLFPEILGYTQNLNHHVSTTSNNVADVSKLSLGTYCSDSLDNTSSFSCSNYDLAHEPIQDTWPQTDEPSQPLKLGSTMYTNSRDLTQQENSQGMVQIGEALLIKDNSNLYAFEGDIQK